MGRLYRRSDKASIDVRTLILVISIFCCLVTSGGPSQADDVSGVINGFIVDDRGFGVDQVTVLAYTTETLRGSLYHGFPVANRSTNKHGFFSFLGLLPAHYVLFASKEGYGSDCSLPITVIPNSLTRVTVHIWTHMTMLHTNCRPQLWADHGAEITF
jgi:Carboxypeptidase regulatory-like domain